MSYAFQTDGLVKRFGATTALAGIDLGVQSGEVHGFLGPNGAGKSTTIRVLLGLLHADAGSVRLLDGDPWRDATRLHRRLAYVPGDVSLWPNISGGEIIDLLGRLRGGLDTARRDDLLERFELDPRKKARTYSKGNRQKVALVSALASRVELLILDEPTSGLDPLMAEVFKDCVAEERRAGRTVFLASHILAEVEQLCDRITIIRAGGIVESGTLDELRHLTRTRVRVLLGRPPGPGEEPPDLPGAHEVGVADGWLSCEVEAGRIGSVLERLAPYDIRELVSQPPSLEEMFLRHYRAETAAPGAEAVR
ncbi:ABC transporter ATP-binding protein [Actinomadura sp. 6K520]|uniref:ABC transporter ATP-binding protein n=1 Tax=Actinomadura sp. 6K520 TaxID=2530364 RepID=UPI00104B5489|nr:ABC transporter ATP-binding protein [Actinomadura sp. 6K520]TDE26620.1 ABC transporter ATP-binding protein [Actinomadura sp. 6K520]